MQGDNGRAQRGEAYSVLESQDLRRDVYLAEICGIRAQDGRGEGVNNVNCSCVQGPCAIHDVRDCQNVLLRALEIIAEGSVGVDHTRHCMEYRKIARKAIWDWFYSLQDEQNKAEISPPWDRRQGT